jgi:hypothetical protein
MYEDKHRFSGLVQRVMIIFLMAFAWSFERLKFLFAFAWVSADK